jgi:hypothetical protein
MISAERLRELLAYDPETGVFTWRSSRCGVAAGSVAGSRKSNGYIKVKVGGRMYRSHRLAWFYVTGVWPVGQLDHINGIRDDNRIANLREATNAENQQNSKCRSGSASGFKGVTRKRNAWRARIKRGGRFIYLGAYKTREEAHAAYRVAAEAHFGEFAKTE